MERYQERAEKSRREAESARKQREKMQDIIPFGEPIKVGHHSEGRHRRHCDKIHNLMGKQVKLEEKAQYYENKTLDDYSISSDDPEAITKLKQRLAKFEESREAIKKHNKEQPDQKFKPYVLTNLGARIRNTKKKIDSLKKAQEIEFSYEGKGFKVITNKEENRIQFLFDGKPNEEIRDILKGRGFRWSPQNKAWQRLLNNNAVFSAKNIARQLSELNF